MVSVCGLWSPFIGSSSKVGGRVLPIHQSPWSIPNGYLITVSCNFGPCNSYVGYPHNEYHCLGMMLPNVRICMRRVCLYMVCVCTRVCFYMIVCIHAYIMYVYKCKCAMNVYICTCACMRTCTCACMCACKPEEWTYSVNETNQRAVGSTF